MSTFRFDHIHLFTRDPEATAAFYERMFGAEVIRSMPQGKPRIDLKLGGANIFILDVSQDPKAATGPSHPHQGLDHFGLEVKDIDAVCADLKAKGARLHPRPRNHPARHPHRLPDRAGGGLYRALGANRGGLVPRPSATAQKRFTSPAGTPTPGTPGLGFSRTWRCPWCRGRASPRSPGSDRAGRSSRA